MDKVGITLGRREVPESVDELRTLLKQYQQDLAASESRFRNIIETNADGILIIDSDGAIRFCNPAAKSLLQRSEEELEGELFGYPVVAGETIEIDIIRGDRTIVIAEMRVAETEWEGETAYLASLRDITERKRAEEEIRFQAQLLDAVEQAVIATDLDGSIIYWNRFAETLYGWSASAVMGQNILEITPAQSTIEEATEVMARLKQGESWSGEFLVQRRNGTTFPALVTDSPVYNSEGELIGIVGISSDITEQKQAEEDLFQRNRELMLLDGASQAFTSTLDLDEVLTTVLEGVRFLLEVTACSVWLVDQESKELVCRQVTDPQSELIRGWRLAPGEGLVGWAAQTGQSLIVPDVRVDNRYFKGVAEQTGLNLRSILSVPLRVKGAVIGVIQVVDEEPDRFSATDLGLLESLAANAAIAIENAQLYKQALQDTKTKAILLNEVNHRVKNNLAAIIGLLYAEKRRDGVKEEAIYQATMKSLINRIQGLATVHDMLSASEWASLPLSELTRQIIWACLQTFPASEQVSVEVTPTSVRVTPKQANCLALVINELTTNTIKYALSEQKQGQIRVNTTLTGDTIYLEFRDNGPGYPQEVLNFDHGNIGLYLIQNLVQNDLGGALTFDNNNGAITIIQFNHVKKEV